MTSSAGWDPKKFLSALLLDRFVPLSLNSEVIQKRCEAVDRISAAFSSPENETAREPQWASLLSKLALGLGRMREGKIADGELLYQEALELLSQGVELEKGDKKKWPEVVAEDRSVRLLTNYYVSDPDRYGLEGAFRRFHTVRHLILAREHLKAGRLLAAEKETVIAQEELRHQVALGLELDLAFLREEAETLSQTENRDERQVTVEWIEKYLNTQGEAAFRLVRPLLAAPYEWNEILNLLNLTEFKPREASASSTEEWVKALRDQPQNLTLHLSSKVTWDVHEGLRSLLHLPDPSRQQYCRMPDVDRFRNSKLFDSQGRLLLHFDEMGRLADAPRVTEIKTGAPDGNAALLDVAVIGGGPGGVAAGVALYCLGIFKIVLFEQSEINATVKDIWSREKEADTWYSGRPDPIEGPIGMQDTTRAVYLNRMKTFVDYFHLNLHTREPVLTLTKDEKEIWILETPQGTYRARNVIMTAGRYGKPKLLKWEEGELPENLQRRIVRGVEVDNIKNSTVLVIGGGNTAFDNVRTLTDQGTGKKGNKVFLSYYRKPFNVPASLHAHNNDQFLQWESEGKLTILWNTNTAAVEAAEGRWKVFFKEPESPPLVVDYIAPAVGWQIDKGMMEGLGVHFVEGKNPDCDPETLQAFTQTSDGRREPIPGLHIAGDYYLQRSVPAAFTTNYRAAVAVAKRLRSGP